MIIKNVKKFTTHTCIRKHVELHNYEKELEDEAATTNVVALVRDQRIYNENLLKEKMSNILLNEDNTKSQNSDHKSKKHYDSVNHSFGHRPKRGAQIGNRTIPVYYTNEKKSKPKTFRL